MNRFEYSSPILIAGENTVAVENNVRLYDGYQKVTVFYMVIYNLNNYFFQTSFQGGELIVTTHRILWGKPGFMARGETCLALELSDIIYVKEELSSTFNFSRSSKVLVYLTDCTGNFLNRNI